MPQQSRKSDCFKTSLSFVLQTVKITYIGKEWFWLCISIFLHFKMVQCFYIIIKQCTFQHSNRTVSCSNYLQCLFCQIYLPFEAMVLVLYLHPFTFQNMLFRSLQYKNPFLQYLPAVFIFCQNYIYFEKMVLVLCIFLDFKIQFDSVF